MATEDPVLEKERVIDRGHELVSTQRVVGAPVWSRQDGKIGTIHSLMVEKTTGKVAYALLSYGGFLGLAARVHPIPWEMLTYDPAFDAYTVDISYDHLKEGPALRLDDAGRPSERNSYQDVAEYYGRVP